jgi:flagellar hook-associated protein FlgK
MPDKIELSAGVELSQIAGINYIEEEDEQIRVVLADGLEVSICRDRFNPDKFDLHMPNRSGGETMGGRFEVYLDAEVVVERVGELAAAAVMQG